MTNVPFKVPVGSVDHALFYRTSLATWVYSSNGNLSVAANTLARVHNQSGTETSNTTIRATRLGAISSVPSVIRTVLMITITKGSPWSLVGTSDSSTTAPDIAISTLYTAMESANPQTVLGSSYANTTITQTVDEGTHGTLDTVFVSWGQSNPPIYISEVLVARLA